VKLAQNVGQDVAQKVGHGVNSNIRRYARIPDAVLFDAELPDSAIRVYAFLSRHVFQGNVAKFGRRLISQRLGMSRRTVDSAVKALMERQHITTASAGRQRGTYILTSPVFGQKAGAVDTVIARPRPRLATVAKSACA
jgi:hypothetical protein